MPEPQEEADPIRKLGQRVQADIVKEAPPGLLERAGGTAMSGLATVGNFLDLPGSMVRDTLSWLPGGPKPQNPFDQLASPFTHHNRLTGRDLLRGYGLVGKEDTMLNFMGGLGAEIALDPLSYLTFGAGALTKGGKAARALNLERNAREVASKLLKRPVGKREARHVVTPRMLVEHVGDAKSATAQSYLDRFKDMGVEGERLDRPLGGMAKISLPFTDRPFTWNQKPVTFWGLTDEEGIIGGGRVRGRGPEPMLDGGYDAPPLDDIGPTTPIPPGSRPGPVADPGIGPSNLDGPDSPMPIDDGIPPQSPEVPPAPIEPTPLPDATGPITPNVRITPKNDMEFDVDVDVPEAGNAKASVAYASDSAEQPRILINSFQREAKAGKGTGRAMINKILEAAKDKNPVSVSGNFDTPQTLGAFGSVFGRENIIFHDRATGKAVDVTFADAMKAPQNYIATHEFKKPVVETIQEAAPAVDDVVPPASVMDNVAPELPPATVQPELRGMEPEVPPVADAPIQPTLPPATLQPTLAGLELPVVKAAKRGRKVKEKPIEAPPPAAVDVPPASSSPELYFSPTLQRTINYTPFGHKATLAGDAGAVAKQAPVNEAIPTANKVDPERVKIVDEFTRRLSRIEVDGRPKYGPKEIEVARALAMGNVDGAISQVRSFNKLGAPVDIDFIKLSGQLVKNKLLDEKQLADFNVKMKDVVAEKVLRDYDVMANTPAQLGQLATLEKWSTLDDSSKQFYSGSKQFGDVVAGRAQVLRKQTQEEIERLAKIEEAKQAKKGKGKLKSEGAPATGPATAPRMVDLKTLEGLPEQAKPIVGDMISKIGQKLFDDVQLQVGGTGSKTTTAGDIDMSTGFIKVYDSAIKNGTVDKTTVHEFWHHLSKYISPDEVRAVRNEFEQAVAAFKKAEGNKPLPYELSSVDEFFAHKLTDLSMKYLGREKPVDLIGKVWAKALDAFEYIWDAIRQTLGYDETKRIMNSFLDGHRAEVSKYTDATMTQRLMDDLEPKDTLLSQSDPILSNSEIAKQLSDFRSAKIGKGLDQIGDRIMDTAPARQLTALFDQSVLGQLTKAGQEAARMAFTAYRDAVTRERQFMSEHLRTWYDTPNIREDVIIAEELPPLEQYVAGVNGDRKLAAKQQMIDARKIQNQRVNDIRRLMETSIFDDEGNVLPNALTVRPEMLPEWVGREKVNGQIIENPAGRVEFARMLTSWRAKVMNMIRDEHNAGVNTKRVDGYFPRIVPDLPGSNTSLWNPNYGKILDPTHPNQKRRKDFLVGYDDGTAIVNDISVDPEFSGVHAKKNIREKLPEHEVIIQAEKLWDKYKDRLLPQHANLSFSELRGVGDGKVSEKIRNLTREIMELDPRHAEYQIPMFSNDLFSGFELRLEHHHRSIMQARAIRTLLHKNALTRESIDGRDGVTLEAVMKGAKFDNPRAANLIVNNIPGEVALQADKLFWTRDVQPRIDYLADRFQRALRRETLEPLVDPLNRKFSYDDANTTITIPNYFDAAKGKDQLDLKIAVDFDNPSASRVTSRVIDDGSPNAVVQDKPFNNPVNVQAGEASDYVSGSPPEAILSEIVIPSDVADAITKFVKGPRVLEEMRPVVRGYDKATNMWKMMQTGMLPFISFHGRNLGSGQASNFYLGIQNDPRFSEFSLAKPDTWLNPIKRFTVPIADAHRLATGQDIKDISKAPMFRDMGLTDAQATERLRRAAYTQGITGEKQGLSAEQLMDTVGTAASQYPGLDPKRGVNPLAWQWSEAVPESTFAQRWLMPWMSKGVLADKDVFRPGQLGRDLGSYTESLNRLSPFIPMIRQGFDPKAAADAVNRAQVDYTNLSNFNREYTRRLFPFASYTMGMAPTVARELMERPGGGMARTVMATTQAGQTAEQGVTPDYIRETASIPLGTSEDGTRSYITGFGLPFEDPLQFAQAARGNVGGLLRELGSRMNPIPKALIEMMTGRSLYQAGPFGGREIEDLDPTIGRIAANVKDLVTGEKTERAEPFISPWAEYAISNAGPGRMLNTIRTLTDARKWDTIPWKLALNLGTGVRVADVSPSAQDAILRERIARIMKDFGGRMYSRPYFPDYATEKWTPQQAEDAAKIDALMKLLNQRARDRKVVAQ